MSLLILGGAIVVAFLVFGLIIRERLERDAELIALCLQRLDRVDRELALYGKWLTGKDTTP